MRTVILCGGKGTRAYPHTTQVPKPLLEVAERPVLQHVMESYAAQGFTSFVLAAGFKIELIDEFARTLPSGWDVDVVDTGEDTNTGGRIARCRDRMGDTFFATYSDGLSDIDLRALQEFHEGHDGTATLTTVPLPSQYGTIVFGEDRRVSLFREKPVLGELAGQLSEFLSVIYAEPVQAAAPSITTETATERLNPSHHISHKPPTSAKGTDNITIRDSVTRRKLR